MKRNERLEHAKRAACEYIQPHEVDFVKELVHMLDALKEVEPTKLDLHGEIARSQGLMKEIREKLKKPESAGKELAQSLVRHPDERVWYCDKDGKNPHFFNQQSHPCDVHCRTMTCAEAFVPGAIAEWKDDTVIVRGPVKNSSEILTTIEIGFAKVPCPTEDVTLVKPATEEK